MTREQQRMQALLERQEAAERAHDPELAHQRSQWLTAADAEIWRACCGEWHYAGRPCASPKRGS
jgi:hypothetical protein